MEASQEKRSACEELIKDIHPQSIVYIDESGIEPTICKDRGWGKKSGKYYERTNIVGGYVNNKSIFPIVFNGSCNTKLFQAWVERFLIKELKPGQFVVMDNARFHKSNKTRELIESVVCKLLFLPPYSPDLNPIEKFWANMKRWIKARINRFDKPYKALEIFFSAQIST